MDHTHDGLMASLAVLMPDGFKNLSLAEYPDGLLCQIKKYTKFQMNQRNFFFIPHYTPLIR